MNNQTLVTTFTDGDHDVALHQHEDGSFTVVYGGEVTTGLDYPNAAKSFGECVFHSLACASKLDNGYGDDE